MFARNALFFVVAGAACSTESEPVSSCDGVELLVAASDYGASVVCGAPGCVKNSKTSGTDLGIDPTLASSNGRAFFVARDNDLLIELDPRCGTPKKNIRLS